MQTSGAKKAAGAHWASECPRNSVRDGAQSPSTAQGKGTISVLCSATEVNAPSSSSGLGLEQGVGAEVETSNPFSPLQESEDDDSEMQPLISSDSEED